MHALLRLFLDIWMLRRGPQDVPYSISLARSLVLLLLALQWALLILLEVEQQLLPQLVYSLIWILGAPWLLLRLRDRQSRYVQTLSAKCGVGLLYLVVFAPVLMVARSIDTTTPDISPEPLQIIAVWGVLGLTVWHLVVSGHIWRHALGVPMFLGTMISIALFASNVLLSRMLFATTP